MHIHHLQHAEFEGLGVIKDWIQEKGYALSTTRLFAGEPLPSVDNFDCLIVMGGPMGVYQELEYPWLINEKLFIKRVIEADKLVIGVCLGAQLIAEVLGAQVKPHKCKEIGWHTVELSPAAIESGLFDGIPSSITAFQWHGDTFDLPTNSIKLASSECTSNQAFICGKAIGLQFHLEVTPHAAKRFICNCAKDLCAAGNYVQEAENILAATENFNNSRLYMKQLLNNIFAKAGLSSLSNVEEAVLSKAV